jgi:TatD DNase family protein
MEYAQEALKGDCLFSFGGTLTYPAAEEIRKVAAFLPADRLVLETDGPYLPPQTKRGQRNEPAFILEAAQKMALIRRVSLEAVSAFTTKNAERFFGI